MIQTGCSSLGCSRRRRMKVTDLYASTHGHPGAPWKGMARPPGLHQPPITLQELWLSCAWRDQSTAYQPGQALAHVWGICSPPKGATPERKPHGAASCGSCNTTSVSLQSGCSQSCCPHRCSDFFCTQHYQLSLRT